MKILIIGGLHGNEPLGIKLVKMIKSKPINNVYAMLANEEAITQNKRFIKFDMNRSFPGNINSENYEMRRAAQITNLCKRYDLILDFHNTYCPNNNCSFLGTKASKILYSISSLLGLKKIIVADYDCLNKYAPNCLSVEISMCDNRMNSKIWYDKITKLANMKSIQTARKISLYKFIYRMTLEDRDRLNLQSKKLKAFKSINKDIAQALGVKHPAYPIFIKDKFTPYDFGSILNKLEKYAMI